MGRLVPWPWGRSPRLLRTPWGGNCGCERSRIARGFGGRPMLTFNQMLIWEGVDPGQVILARHQEGLHDLAPYWAWREQQGRFEQYQCIQRRKVFGRPLVASFVVGPQHETLFVGLYSVKGSTEVPDGTADPLTGEMVGGLHYYDMEPDSRLALYVGRLVIDWTGGNRNWFRKADIYVEPVLELRRDTVGGDHWPGFRDFAWLVQDVDLLPASWRGHLQAVKGVYLLVDLETGKQYVGSATGPDSLWGRLQDYARTGHGGNVELMKRNEWRFQFCVLEYLSDDEEVRRAEAAWKRKLLTRDFGLNQN